MKDEYVLRPMFTWRSALASKHGPASGTTRHVLLTLALHMSEKGDSCFPSVDLLTEETGLSRKTVIDHLKMAAEAGWIEKSERPQRNGQGWRRMEYLAIIPAGLEGKLKAEKAGERATPPQEQPVDNSPEGGERSAKGGEPDGTKVVYDVHPSTSMSTPKRFTPNPEEKGQGQNRSAGPTCCNPACKKPLTAGFTEMANGKACPACWTSYMAGAWNPNKETA